MKNQLNSELISYGSIGTQTIKYEEGDSITLNGYEYIFSMNNELHSGEVWLMEGETNIKESVHSAYQHYVDYFNQNL